MRHREVELKYGLATWFKVELHLFFRPLVIKLLVFRSSQNYKIGFQYSSLLHVITPYDYLSLH